MKRPIFLVTVLVILLSACSHVDVTLYRDTYPPTKGRGPLDLLRTYHTKRPEKPYHEIGQIICHSKNENWNYDMLQQKSMEIGADAIIIVGKDKDEGSELIGIAIKYGYKPPVIYMFKYAIELED